MFLGCCTDCVIQQRILEEEHILKGREEGAVQKKKLLNNWKLEVTKLWAILLQIYNWQLIKHY